MNLHLIERGNCIHPLDRQQRLFSSGYWKISPDRANSLIGQRVYFHKHRNSRSHFGGEIVGFRVVPAEQDDAGRIELHFRLTDSRAGKGVDASSAPWGREKAFMPPAPDVRTIAL